MGKGGGLKSRVVVWFLNGVCNASGILRTHHEPQGVQHMQLRSCSGIARSSSHVFGKGGYRPLVLDSVLFLFATPRSCMRVYVIPPTRIQNVRRLVIGSSMMLPPASTSAERGRGGGD